MSEYKPFDGSKFKVGDEVAVSTRYGDSYRFHRISKITATGRISLEGRDGTWRPDGTSMDKGVAAYRETLYWPELAREQIKQRQQQAAMTTDVQDLLDLIKGEKCGDGHYRWSADRMVLVNQLREFIKREQAEQAAAWKAEQDARDEERRIRGW